MTNSGQRGRPCFAAAKEVFRVGLFEIAVLCIIWQSPSGHSRITVGGLEREESNGGDATHQVPKQRTWSMEVCG